MKFSLASVLSLTLLPAVAARVGSERRQLQDGYCMDVVITGSAGGPVFFNGLTGTGTLVTYGREEDNCRGTNLQFDIGRGTTLQLSKLGLQPKLPLAFEDPNFAMDAIFLTHLHNDHTDDLYVYMSAFWLFGGNGSPANGGPNQKIDVVCAEDVTNEGNGVTSSCRNFVENIGAPLIASGEVAQRNGEAGFRSPNGPSALANVVTFSLPDRKVVWQKGDVEVEAVGSIHIGGHASYRINTPVGSVVVGGDASSGGAVPSTSSSVEALAQGADVLVHSVVHPVFAPGVEGNTFPPFAYARQSNAPDLGAMASRLGVGTVITSHQIPSIGEDTWGGVWQVPGGPLHEGDFASEIASGGFTGAIFEGTDLLSIRSPFNPRLEAQSNCNVDLQAGRGAYWAGLQVGFDSASAVLNFSGSGLDLSSVSVNGGVFSNVVVDGQTITLEKPEWVSGNSPGYIGLSGQNVPELGTFMIPFCASSN